MEFDKIMSTYLLINLAIITAPVLALVVPIKKWRNTAKSALIYTLPVMLFFLVWDIWFSATKVWTFNQTHILNSYLFYLPIEEILFFPAVAFTVAFFMYLSQVYVKQKDFLLNRYLFFILALLGIVIALLNVNRLYTFVVSIVLSTVFVFQLIKLKHFNNMHYIHTIIYSFLGFLFMNALLTGIPVVLYNPSQITGIRIGTIPLEDFFFNYALVTLYYYALKNPVFKRGLSVDASMLTE